MYEDLINRLRNTYTIPPSTVATMHEAADAIEELSRAQEQWIEPERKLLLQSIPKWIPVTERLPELDHTGFSKDLLVCMRRWDGEDYYIELFTGYLTQYNIWYTYQHDDCSQVGIERHMKHSHKTADEIVAWMPLPEPYEPPKEET